MAIDREAIERRPASAVRMDARAFAESLPGVTQPFGYFVRRAPTLRA